MTEDMTQFALAVRALSISTKKLLTKDECATMLGITKDALNKRVSQRTIPHYKNGGHVYFSREDVESEILSPRCRCESVAEQNTQLIRVSTRKAEKIKMHPKFAGVANA